MIKKIDHIGIAVDDLKKYLSIYRDVLGMEYLGTETVEEQKVKIGLLKIGEIRIELLQATSKDSPVAKFLAKKGGGIHHIAYQVDNLEATLRECEEKGIEVVDKKSRPGISGSMISFLHPGSMGGVLTELTTGQGSGIK